MSESRHKEVQPIACGPDKIEELCLMVGRKAEINEAGKPNLGMLQEIEAEIARRRKGWIEVREGIGARFAFLAVGSVFAVPLATLAIINFAGASPWAALVVPVLIVFFAAYRWPRRYTFWRAAKRVEKRVCPGCAYVFDGLPACVIEGQARTFAYGPFECPECGMPWPLVPPKPPPVLAVVSSLGDEDPY